MLKLCVVFTSDIFEMAYTMPLQVALTLVQKVPLRVRAWGSTSEPLPLSALEPVAAVHLKQKVLYSSEDTPRLETTPIGGQHTLRGWTGE